MPYAPYVGFRYKSPILILLNFAKLVQGGQGSEGVDCVDSEDRLPGYKTLSLTNQVSLDELLDLCVPRISL